MFISVEGGEGVGKSLFVKGLAAELKNARQSTVVTREPGGSPLGESLRSLFNHPPEDDPFTPEGEFLLVSAARAQHVAYRIKPALARGDWVISDRFFDSTYVYQGVLGGITRDMLDRVVPFSTSGLQPTLTFLLDCDVDIALSRVKKRTSEGIRQTRFDTAQRQHHQLIRDAYLQLAKEFRDRFVVLDASQTADVLVDLAVKRIFARKGE
ncbi:MAG: dTMP kinase [Deltaproteobacteria bacterium]|nr:dTMP kinase [Deltaproteobacteria bacterium]